MMAKARAFAACVVMVLLADAAMVNASPIVFTDRSSFEAAAQPNRNLQFDADFTACEFIDSFTCVHTFDNLLTVAYDFAGIGLLGDSIGLGPWGGQSSGAWFLEPVTAVGFDLISIPQVGFGSQPAEFHIGGSTFPIDARRSALPRFFGAIFDEPTTFLAAFANVNFATPHGGLVGFSVTNMSVTTVPEPSTITLLTAGALATTGAWWRRRRGRRPRSA